uniref:ABC transporter substrate-binding protein n=1 Tax=Agrobacterium pusense TaxID=648995 RepID=UPI0032DA69AE
MKLNRRNTLALLGGGAVAVLQASKLSAQSTTELVIVSYAGALSQPHRWLADQMEARHKGLSVKLVPSDSQDIVAQIKASQGFSPYDAGPNDEPPHLIGIKEGYLAKRDDSAIPNLKNVIPELLEKSHGFGVPATYSLVGIAYNTNLVKSPILSWKDLWKPEFKGQIGIARTSSNLGLTTLAIAAKTFGGSEQNLETGWDKLKELEPKAARSPAALMQMLEREEIAVAPIWNNNAALAAQKGLPIAFVKPAPGPIAIVSCFSGFKGTRNPELVSEWLNGILSPEYQERAAAAPYYFGPTVKGVKVSPEAAPYLPSSSVELASLETIDWSAILPI